MEDYLPEILSADAVKHEIDSEICDEESVKNILQGNCRVLILSGVRLRRAEAQ